MEGNFQLIDENFLQFAYEIKQLTELDHSSKKSLLQDGQDVVTCLREQLNHKFNNNLLGMPKYMTVDNQMLLDKHMNELISQWFYYKKREHLDNFDMSVFYNAFENEITY